MPAQRRWALALTSVAFFMTALDALVVATALPAIHASLGGNVSTLEWTVNAYTLPFAAGIITAAALGDRLGRRKMYVTGLLVFTLASAACAVAPNAGTLIGARAIQGLGAALVTPLSLTILASAFPPERRGAVVGILGGIGGLAIAGGPLIGGVVVQGLDWHWIFWLNVPIGVVAAVFAASKLPESRGPASSLDVPGVLLAAAGAAVLAWGLVHSTDAGWGSASVLWALILAAALLTAFALWERHAPEPMLPIALLRIRAFTAANLVGFLSLGSTFSAAFLMSQYFQIGLGYSPLATGLRFLPWTLTPLLIAPGAGALSDRIGRQPLMVAGLALQAAGLGWIALHASATSGYAGFVIPFIVAGVGVSMVIPTAPAAALSAVPAQDLGKASGVQNTLQRFGSVVGVAIVTAVFGATGHLGTAAGIVAGFRPGLGAAAGMSAVGVLAALAAGSPAADRTQAAAETPALAPARR